MNAPLTTTREVLIAELIGDIDALVGRLEKIKPELEASADRFKTTTQAIAEQAQTSAVQHIVRKTNEQVKQAETEIAAVIRTALAREIAAARQELAAVAVVTARPGRWGWIDRILGR